MPLRFLPIEVSGDGQVASGVDTSHYNRIYGNKQTINKLADIMMGHQTFLCEGRDVDSIFGMKIVVSDCMPENQIVLLDTTGIYGEVAMEISNPREIRWGDAEREWRISGEWDLHHGSNELKLDNKEAIRQWEEIWG
jgi:hypothetical protein